MSNQHQRAVNFSLLGLTALLIVVLAQLLDGLWVYFELPDQQLVGFVNYPVLVALAIGVVSGFVLSRNHKVNQFLREVVTELKEVVWPTRQEVYDSTRVVILTVVLLSGLMGLFDAIWSHAARFLLQGSL